MFRLHHWGIGVSLLVLLLAAAATAYAQGTLQEAAQAGERVRQLHGEGRDREALPFAQKALAICRRIHGEEHSETGVCYNLLGSVQEGLGDYRSAIASYEQALRIQRKTQVADSLDVVANLNNLGTANESLGEYGKSRAYLEQALAINRRARGEEHVATAFSYNNLGATFRSMGRYAAARESFDKALRIRRKLLGEEHENTLNVWGNLAELLQEEGNFADARKYHEYVLHLRQRVLGAEHPDVALTLNALGVTLQALGDNEAARGRLEQAIKIQTKVLGRDNEFTAVSVNNLGFVLREQGKFDAAKTALDDALRARRKIFGDEHVDVAQSLVNLGDLLSAQQQYSAALPLYEKSLAIRTKVKGPDHPFVATVHNLIGVTQTRLGNFEAAREPYERAVAVQAKALGEANDGLTIYLANLIEVDARAGQLEAAAGHADRALRCAAAHTAKNLPALSEREQIVFLRGAAGRVTRAALSLAIWHSEDARLAERSAEWLLNGKAVAQESLAARAYLTRTTLDEKQQAAARNLADIRRRLASFALTVPTKGQEEVRRQLIADLTKEEEQLSRTLATSRNSAGAPVWRELAQLRAGLPKDSLFIDIARFDRFNYEAKGQGDKLLGNYFAAWIIPPAGAGDVRLIDLGPASAIDKAIVELRQGIASANEALQSEGEAAAERSLAPALARVAELVWQPLAKELGSAKRLFLSPDGELWLLPWAALPVAENTCLLERMPVQFVLSGRDFLSPATEKLKTSVPMLFADPDYDLPPDKMAQAIRAVYPQLNQPNAGPIPTARSLLPRVTRLPGTAEEADAIGLSVERLFDKKPQKYTANYALETLVKRVERPVLLTLSTHGFFLKEQAADLSDPQSAASPTPEFIHSKEGEALENPLLRCGLLLAGCNAKQSANGDDGVLTGLEIVGIDLRGTQMVVLSACETGIGKVQQGEGVAGLRQAFQLAGAQAVVSTLWQVPDRDSALIMTDFFAALAEGQSKADALRAAQLKRINARREKGGAAHPFFWAAWTVTGT